MDTVFYIASGVTVAATAMAITRLSPVHSLLYLIVSLLALSLVFFVLGAPFIAALQVTIYSGAIMILFVFVIMMLNQGPASVEQERQWLSARMWWGPVYLSSILAVLIVFILMGDKASLPGGRAIEPKEVGLALYGPYGAAVELASLLLIAGLVGAYHLGRPDAKTKDLPTMMANVPMEHGLILAAVIFCLGLAGVYARNLLYQLMSIEIMLNGAALAFIVAGARWSQPDGQIMVLIILTMAAAEVAVGLALVLRFHHQYKTLDADAASEMRG